MWQLAGIAITSLNIYYSELPETVNLYGTEYSVERFYDQKVPSFVLGGYYKMQDNNWINWNVNTGIHTKKLDTGNITLGYNHRFKIDDSSSIKLSVSNSYYVTKHKPCETEYRQFYCGNLTSWKEFESKKNETNIQKVSVSYAYRW